jgi:hypothetical protein
VGDYWHKRSTFIVSDNVIGLVTDSVQCEKNNVAEDRNRQNEHLLIPHRAVEGSHTKPLCIEYLFPQESAAKTWSIIESPVPFRQIVSLNNWVNYRIIQAHKLKLKLTDPPG